MTHRRFYHELTPLAEALERIRESTPARLSTCKDVPEIMAKRAAKMTRRAARAERQVKP